MGRRAVVIWGLVGSILLSAVDCLEVPTLTFVEPDSSASPDSSAAVVDVGVASSGGSDAKPPSVGCPDQPPAGATACCAAVPCNGDCAAHCGECQSKCTSSGQFCCAKVAVACHAPGVPCN